MVPTLTKVVGNHTLKFGADMVYAMRADAGTGYANGNLSFNRYGTQQYPLSSINNKDGSGIADLMLGIPGTGFVDYNDTYYRTWPYFGLFVQNDWKLRRNLTLNLGLRYDVQFPLIERWNRVNSGFDFNAVNPDSAASLAAWNANAAAYNATNPEISVSGGARPRCSAARRSSSPAITRRIYNTDWQNIQPRIGVAWQFLPNTVLRTGAGIFHRTATQNGYADGFSLQTPYQRSINGDITPSAGLTGPYSLQDLFPNGLQVPAGSSLGLLTNVGNAVSFDGRQRVIPRTFQYSFGIQRQIWAQIMLDASYVGSYTNHETLTSTYNLDALPYPIYPAVYRRQQPVRSHGEQSVLRRGARDHQPRVRQDDRRQDPDGALSAVQQRRQHRVQSVGPLSLRFAAVEGGQALHRRPQQGRRAHGGLRLLLLQEFPGREFPERLRRQAGARTGALRQAAERDAQRRLGSAVRQGPPLSWQALSVRWTPPSAAGRCTMSTPTAPATRSAASMR